jgi:hypothetical protein
MSEDSNENLMFKNANERLVLNKITPESTNKYSMNNVMVNFVDLIIMSFQSIKILIHRTTQLQ